MLVIITIDNKQGRRHGRHNHASHTKTILEFCQLNPGVSIKMTGGSFPRVSPAE